MARFEKLIPYFAVLLTILMGGYFLSLANGQVRPDITAFNAGEVSPLMYGRTDLQKYGNAAKTMQNMVVTSLGPAVRRPGLKFISEIKDSNDRGRLIPFEYSNTDTYILEFGSRYMRPFRNGGPVIQNDDSIYEVATPFTPDEVNDLQWVQSADVMYLVDGNDPPYTLSRTDHNVWTFTALDYNDGPFQLENLTDTTIRANTITIDSNLLSGWATGTAYIVGDVNYNGNILYECISAHTSGASTEPGTGASWQGKWKETLIPDGAVIGFTSSVNLWGATDVNSLWQITHKRAAKTLSGSFTSATTSDSITCKSNYTATTHGTWTGVVYLERSSDAGVTWELVEPRSSQKDDNMLRRADENEDGIIYRFRMYSYTSGTCQYDLSIDDYEHSGSFRITGYTNAKNVTAEAASTISSRQSTKLWNKPYWSDSEGWPRTIEFHEGRLYYGGNSGWPQTVWGSRVGDWPNMKAGPEDDDALTFLLPGQNSIQWMLSHDQLLIGSSGAVGVMSGSTEYEPITPSSINYQVQNRFGSSSLRGLLAGDLVIYFEKDYRTLRGLTYDFSRDRFVSPDLTILSSHITESGIVGMAYQGHPDSMLWCVRDDGDAALFVYEGDNEVTGWSRIVTDGDIESVAVIPSVNEDEVWFIINRDINGVTHRYIEQVQNYDWGTDQVDCFFVDCGVTRDMGDAVNISAVTNANPGVVTVSVWPSDAAGTALADGNQVKIVGVKGMTQLNGNVYSISNPNVGSKTFQLRNSADTANVNTTAYGVYTSAGTVRQFEKTFGGFGYLEAKELSVMSDGGVLADVTVSNGSVTLAQWTNKAHIGLPYTSILETLPLYLRDQMGSLRTNQKRLVEVGIDFYQTAGAQYGTGHSSSDLESITFRAVADDPNDPVPLFSGVKRLSNQTGWSDELTIYITQEYALPLTVRGVTARVEVGN